MSHKQVIVIRKDLNMRKGKMVAQGAHASLAVILVELQQGLGLEDPRIKPWVTGKFKKICVSVNSEDELCKVTEAAKNAGLLYVPIVDSGLTEFNGVPTLTCAAIGPDLEEKINEITGHLPLL